LKVKNKYIKIKNGEKEIELHNLILQKYLDYYATSTLSVTDKELDVCMINCTVVEEITPDMTEMHYDFFLNEKNQYNNDDVKSPNLITTQYLYSSNYIEQIQPYVGQKILSIGFGQFIVEPSPEGEYEEIELYAIVDVSNYNLYVQDNQEFMIQRVDEIITDLDFSSDTETFPVNLSPRGNNYFDKEEEVGVIEQAKLISVGTGYTNNSTDNLIPIEELDVTLADNEINIEGLSIEEYTGEELYPRSRLYPANQWEVQLSSSEIASTVTLYVKTIDGKGTQAFVDIYGKSIQDGTPTPSNPVEIQSVADDVNILNYGTKEFTSFYQEYGLNIPAGTYTFSAKVTSNDTTYNISRVYFYDANGTSLGFVNLSRDERASGTITLSGTAVRVTLYSSIDYSSSNGKTATYEDIKLQKGTVATPYSEYGKGTITIKQNNTIYYTLPTEPLRSLPNGVKDTIEKDGIHRRVGRVVLDGSEDWIFHNGNPNYPEFKLSNFSNGNGVNDTIIYPLLCNYFVSTPQTVVFNGGEGIQLLGGNINAIYLCPGVPITLADFKTWLSTHNTEVIYELAEEVIEPFTEEQYNILSTICTVPTTIKRNIFTTTDELSPIIQVTQYLSALYPHQAQMHWIIYEYGVYQKDGADYIDTGRRYTQGLNTNKSGNLNLKIKYERG